MQAWNKISRMPAPAIRKMQDELLHKMINEELAVRHPHYRALFKDKEVNLADIKGVEDLKKLPFTEKEDLLPRDDDLRYPKRFVLEAPAEGEIKVKKKGFSLFGKKDTEPDLSDYKFFALYFSAGRTNRPVPFEYTQYDLKNLKEAGVRAFDILGLTRDDTMINAFTFAPNPFYWQMFYSTLEIGSTSLQTGGGKVLGLEKILKAVDNLEAPVIAAAPGYALFALQTLKFFGFSAEELERVILGIDYTPLEAVEKVKKLMASVGTKDQKVQRIYFVSEAKSGWAECEPGYGYHTNPDHILIEIVDPDSGEVLGEGEKGEVVVTHLDTRGTVLLRCKTGDIATGGLVTEPCPNCKRTVPRLMGDIEPSSMYFELQGNEGPVNFNFNHLRKMMVTREDILLWYTEINRVQSEDNLKIVFKGVSGTDESALLDSLTEDITNQFQVPVTAETSTLDAIANKIGLEKYITEQLIFDNRNL